MSNNYSQEDIAFYRKLCLDQVLAYFEDGQELDLGDKLLIKNEIFREFDNYFAETGELTYSPDHFDWLKIRRFGYNSPLLNERMYVHLCQSMDEKAVTPERKRELAKRKIDALRGHWK
ncbi:hypothetical protein HY837_07095 [archaeon]|nr:hypothetical protein [archaeon]